MISAKAYDLAVVGAGPGGYVAALYASRKKMRVCLIERGDVGGACLNRGCISTKTLINSASLLSAIKGSSAYGINVEGCKLDYHKVLARKNEIVLRLRSGIETLLKAGHIELLRGNAHLLGPNAIDIDHEFIVNSKYIIIAAGSRPMALSGMKIDETDILSSDGILDMKELPKDLVIVGGGVIGCEFASLFATFGVKVTIVELTERLIPTQSREASKKLEMAFKKTGIEVLTRSSVGAINKAGGTLEIVLSGSKTLKAEKALISVGRKSDTEGLDLERWGVKTEKGRIVVDEHLRTAADNIYAIGDCVQGPLLAHKASYDAILACDNILDEVRLVDYSNIPSCIWTEPEIASVGLTEEEARAASPDIKISKFPYMGSGKAFLLGKPEGYAKIIGDPDGKILGVEIFGYGACDLIAEAVLAKTAGLNLKDWARVVHGHPTLSEILQEAAHVFCGTPIHGL